MKKSKIIVPALGLLLLSTAASVSGTVAWFTANRVYTNTISAFHVGSIDGALDATAVITPLAGVEEDSQHAGTVLFQTEQNSAKVPSYLADASYDHTSGKLYTDNGSYTTDGGLNTSYFIDLDDASESHWYAGTKDSNRYYYGFAWNTQFTYTFGAETTGIDFFVDLSSVGTNFSVARGNTQNKTAQIEKSLRVGLICGSEKIVLAPFHASGDAAAIKYVNGTEPSGNPDADPLGTYTHAAAVNTASANLVTGATITSTNAKFNFEKAVDNTAHSSLSARVDYLGQFTNVTPGTTNKLTVTVVVWLDGLDSATVKDSDLADTLSGSLKFYVVTPAA